MFARTVLTISIFFLQVKQMLLGSEGSWVWLGLKRGQRYESDPIFFVQLQRVEIPEAGHVYINVDADHR